jgi:hypothetical protein
VSTPSKEATLPPPTLSLFTASRHQLASPLLLHLKAATFYKHTESYTEEEQMEKLAADSDSESNVVKPNKALDKPNSR